jgi:hypothetical protein
VEVVGVGGVLRGLSARAHVRGNVDSPSHDSCLGRTR